MYHRQGRIQNFYKLLSTALEAKDAKMDGSDLHMFDDKKGRNDAMNALAAHYFQMNEIERNKVNSNREVAQKHY